MNASQSPRFHLIFFHDGCYCQVNMTIAFDTSKWFWITCVRRKYEQDSIFSDWIVGKRLSMLCLQLCVLHLVANWHDVFTRNSEFEVCSAAFWALCNPCISWVTPVFYSEMQVSWRVAKFLNLSYWVRVQRTHTLRYSRLSKFSFCESKLLVRLAWFWQPGQLQTATKTISSKWMLIWNMNHHTALVASSPCMASSQHAKWIGLFMVEIN